MKAKKVKIGGMTLSQVRASVFSKPTWKVSGDVLDLGAVQSRIQDEKAAAMAAGEALAIKGMCLYAQEVPELLGDEKFQSVLRFLVRDFHIRYYGYNPERGGVSQ